MEAFGKEGVVYLETQLNVDGYERADGTRFSTDEVADIFRERLAAKDAKATGVTVRFQNALLRFAPDCRSSDCSELYAINDQLSRSVRRRQHGGREDDDKGYPLRFLPTLRELRHAIRTSTCRFTPAKWTSRTSTSATRCCWARSASATASI